MKTNSSSDPLLTGPDPRLGTCVMEWEEKLMALLDLKEQQLLTHEQVTEYQRNLLKAKHAEMLFLTFLICGGIGVVINLPNLLFLSIWLAGLGLGMAWLKPHEHFCLHMKHLTPTLNKNNDRKARLINVWSKTSNVALRERIGDFLQHHENPNIPVAFWELMEGMMLSAPYEGGVMRPVNINEVISQSKIQTEHSIPQLGLLCHTETDIEANSSSHKASS